MVAVRYRGELRAMTGKAGEDVEAAQVSGVLRHIKSAYGVSVYKEARRMLIVVDNESILLRQSYNTPLSDGAVVQFFPICGGG